MNIRQIRNSVESETVENFHEVNGQDEVRSSVKIGTRKRLVGFEGAEPLIVPDGLSHARSPLRGKEFIPNIAESKWSVHGVPQTVRVTGRTTGDRPAVVEVSYRLTDDVQLFPPAPAEIRNLFSDVLPL